MSTLVEQLIKSVVEKNKEYATNSKKAAVKNAKSHQKNS
ncbi:hypothetical protein BN424_2554 [Carnobacterium maltaromaticum LMA28]|jgi:hypothetical protein|uniref:Uncharacterized protein n=1 Tax=Carnobacterium maltaromaticum LMA28 TaxID=1234679 RepID=K8EJH7_CARML|nr:hypothetical protein BN424_2554 [Carnobacterium maltaromaticum LMA28]